VIDLAMATRIALAVGALLCAALLPAEAQHAGNVYRIGVLENIGAASNAANLDAFRQGLSELGYVEGQNFVLEYRSADGRPERFPDLAAELVRLEADVIVTRGTPAALSAKQVTSTTPIMMATSGDPTAEGIVTSLARPGGNVTGLHILAPPESWAAGGCSSSKRPYPGQHGSASSGIRLVCSPR
jgi:putative tryptophan/tyrosine transport system substrate-binding protein